MKPDVNAKKDARACKVMDDPSDGVRCSREKRLLSKAQCAMDNNNLEEAERLAGRAVRLGSTHSKIVRIWIQSAWRQDKLTVALRRANRYLKLHPDDINLFLMAIRLHGAVRGPNQALKRLNKEMVHFEGARPWVLKFELLQRIGDTKQALDVMRGMRHCWPNLGMVLIAMVQFYHSHGRYQVARKVLNHLLKRQPNHRQARIMRWSLVNPNKNAPSLINRLESLRGSSQMTNTDVAELLRVIELTPDNDLIPECQEALKFLSNFEDDLFNESKLLVLLQQAERFKCYDVAAHALRKILTSGPRDLTVARALLRKAITSLANHHHDAVLSRLSRYIPKAQYSTLETDYILWTEGPQAVIEKRQRDGGRRNRHEAIKLARLLKRGRSCCLALRYLRFCYRSWPGSPDVRIEYATALVDIGEPETALAVLSGSFPSAKWVQVTSQRARALLEAGRLQEAKTELERVHIRKLDNSISSVLLRILISEGQEEAAKSLVQEVKRRGLHRGIGSDHLTPSIYGNLLSDLSLCRGEQAALPPEKHDEYLAIRYVHAASNFIGNVNEWDNTVPIKESIPWQVVQYWDDPHPPESVADIMNSWANCSGIEYVCFNSRMARTFLRSSFGADYERAFRMANNLAEGADFFRLCYLRRFGGIYADADDRLYGSLGTLLKNAAGMLCFREPFGILANNVIACRPEHPAIILASELALEALLSNDNESTWSKTGPGLLTRAVASYLAINTPEKPEDKVAIMPQYMLRRQVQIHISLPHKTTKRHWNSTNTSKGGGAASLSYLSALVD